MQNEKVHLFAQEVKGDESYIVATKEGLLSLQTAIEKALHEEKSTVILTTSDGQPFSLHIAQNNSPSFWQEIKLPYTSSYSKEGRVEFIEPSTLFYEKTFYNK